MNSNKIASTLFAAAFLMAGLAGCQKNESVAEKGPAEKAGQQIDKATAKAGAEINKVAEKAGAQLEKVGEKIQGAAKDAQSSSAPKP